MPKHEEIIDIPQDKICLVLKTERSSWVLDGTHYSRKPLADRNGHEDMIMQNAIEGRLDDNKMHAYEYARWIKKNGEWRVNIKPIAGPKDGYGIETGYVQEYFYMTSEESEAIQKKYNLTGDTIQ